MLPKIWLKVIDWLNKQVLRTGAPYMAFGIFGILNYPSSFFIWHDVIPQTFNPPSFRIIATFLCIPLVLYKLWPTNLKKYLPLYWYLTVLYCIPFFGTFMLLMNHVSSAWLMNMVLGLFLFVLLVDWLMFLILLVLGVSFAWFFYSLSDSSIYRIDHNALSLAIYMYFFAILIGFVFSRNKEQLVNEKLRTLQAIGANVAHELRTPLRTIQAGANGLKKYLPQLLETYELAKQENLPVPKINLMHKQALVSALDNINSEVQASFVFIDMLLTNANESSIGKNFQKCSIAQCVQVAIERYPFNENERKLLHFNMIHDFNFIGNQELMVHVLFNLIKNALYYLREANKGEISIWIENEVKYNILHFKDTGKGIAEKVLPHIFDRFYSRTYHGAGVGLAFCMLVMQSFGGDISCRSVEDKYADFSMRFPKLV
jgi:signal transduction histidine kinase